MATNASAPPRNPPNGSAVPSSAQKSGSETSAARGKPRRAMRAVEDAVRVVLARKTARRQQVTIVPSTIDTQIVGDVKPS